METNEDRFGFDDETINPKIEDYLGSPIKVGDRGIRVITQNTYRPLSKFTVVDIDPFAHYNQLKILVDGAKRASRASAHLVIIQGSLNVEL